MAEAGKLIDAPMSNQCDCTLCDIGRTFAAIADRLPEYSHRLLNDMFLVIEESMDDACYYRMCYEGTWPSQTVEHENEMHKRRLKNIQKRIRKEPATWHCKD